MDGEQKAQLRLLVGHVHWGFAFGGMGTLIGPSIGALLITGRNECFSKKFFESGHQLFFGILLAVVIVRAPKG